MDENEVESYALAQLDGIEKKLWKIGGKTEGNREEERNGNRQIKTEKEWIVEYVRAMKKVRMNA